MATEQAHEAAPAAVETAPIVGADNPDSLPSDKAALLAMMSAPQEEGEAPEEIEPEQDETPQEEELAPEEEETPEPEAEPETEGDEEPHLNAKARNVRGKIDHITDPKERRVVELVLKKGLTLTEANRAVYGTESQSGDTQAKAAAVNPIEGIDREISQLNQEISELDTKIEEAQFDDEARAALLKQSRELNRKIGKLEAKKESIASRQEADVEQTRQSEIDKSFNQTVEEFPDAFAKDDSTGKYTFDRSTRLGRLAANRYKLAQGTPAASSPDFIAIVVAEAADIIGYEKSKPVSQVRAKQPATRPPQRGVRPVPTGGIEPTNHDDPARIKEVLKTGSQKDLLAELSRLGLKI